MTLNELIEEVDVVATEGDLGVSIAGLCCDSRRARPGDVFFALPGLRADGGAFARAALESGAVAVVAPRRAPGAFPAENLAAARVEVEDARLALAQAANRFFGHPSRQLRVVGVTGTNGKTTITWMLESIFRAAGTRAGVIGTTGARFGDHDRKLRFTTPEAPELQLLLREMVDSGIEVAALEVSSHALAQRRSHGLECDVTVFTNLSHDHLDYHGTMESYLDAKLMLFDGRNGPSAKRRFAVVNADDPVSMRVIEAARRGGLEVLMTGLDLAETAPPIKLDMQVEGIRPDSEGLSLQTWIGFGPQWPREVGGRPLDHAGGEIPIRLPLLGRYNAVNAILACGAAMLMGIRHQDVVLGLESLPAIPGRLERVRAGQPFAVVVDYAHTPDALARALEAVREHFTGRVLLVFGCGGNRDRAKRPVMGAIAEKHAALAWVTSDNPRNEDPAAIAREILAGVAVTPGPGSRVRLELDRRAAIATTLAEARAGDVVLIAGKGHETTQTIGDRVLPFDDREVARDWIAAAGWRE